MSAEKPAPDGRDPVIYLVVENGCAYFQPIAFPDAVQCGLRAALEAIRG